MEAIIAAKERGNFASREEIKKLLKFLFENLKKQSHDPLIVRIFPTLFSEEEKEKIPRYEPVEIENITIGHLSKIKSLKKGIEETLTEITQTFNEQHLDWLNSDLRQTWRAEWLFARGILKEIDKILDEVENELKK